MSTDVTAAVVEPQHLPIDYRPAGESRHTGPAEVCTTCSDFKQGILVPVSFCPIAAERSTEMWAFHSGQGPRPTWM